MTYRFEISMVIYRSRKNKEEMTFDAEKKVAVMGSQTTG
jgi:hypothetical protein